MALCRLGTRIILSLAICGTGVNQALAAQPAGPPAGDTRPPSERFASHPYKSAIGALANYGSCGIRVRARAFDALSAELRSIEALAGTKGLGPTLERLRQDYYDLRAVSTMAACFGGPAAALAGAHRAMDAFRTWVAEQPAR